MVMCDQSSLLTQQQAGWPSIDLWAACRRKKRTHKTRRAVARVEYCGATRQNPEPGQWLGLSGSQALGGHTGWLLLAWQDQGPFFGDKLPASYIYACHLAGRTRGSNCIHDVPCWLPRAATTPLLAAQGSVKTPPSPVLASICSSLCCDCDTPFTATPSAACYYYVGRRLLLVTVWRIGLAGACRPSTEAFVLS